MAAGVLVLPPSALRASHEYVVKGVRDQIDRSRVLTREAFAGRSRRRQGYGQGALSTCWLRTPKVCENMHFVQSICTSGAGTHCLRVQLALTQRRALARRGPDREASCRTWLATPRAPPRCASLDTSHINCQYDAQTQSLESLLAVIQAPHVDQPHVWRAATVSGKRRQSDGPAIA